MTTTTCTWNVDWNQCANCARLKKRVDDAHAALLAASERVDQAYNEYRDVRDAGHVAFGTPSHRAWQARLDNLEQQVDEASAASRAAIDEWGKSIRLHHRFHMAYTRIDAAGHVDTGETTTLAETEEMEEVPRADSLIRAGKLMGILDHDNTPSDSTDHLTDVAHPTLHDTETEDLDGLRQAVQDMADGDLAAISLISIGRREMARDVRKALTTIIYNIDHISTDLLSQEAHHA